MSSESKRGRPARPAPPKRPLPRKRSGLRDMVALDSDRASRLLLWGGVALIILIAAGFIGFGYYYTVIRPRHRTVLAADGISISYLAMKRRMAYDLQQNPSYLQSQAALASLPQAVYQELLDEIVLVTRGPSDQGIQISPADFDLQLRTKIGVAKDASLQQFAAAFRGVLQRSGLHEDEYRRMVLAQMIEGKIRAKITQELPATVPQAKVEVIQVATKAAADAALFRVKAGQDWATVAKEVSTEPNKATTGGLHDYTTEGDMNPAYSGFAFSAKPGQISDVITAGSSSAATYYVVRLVDRADKPLTAQQKPGEVNSRYSKWLSDMQAKMVITNHWDQTSQTDALISVLKALPPPTPTAAAAPAPSAPAPHPTAHAGASPAPQGTAAAQPAATAPAGNPPVPNAPVAPGGGNGR
ncbi:MAG: peptidylprolyl isomerase [Chloroflexota bacterium]|nr:peptidylprolyl isomerase [Chloroflexota bacterium]